MIVENRDDVQARLKELGVPTAVYYPKPLHLQTAYKDYPIAGGNLPVSTRLSDGVLSLPMHPYMEEKTQDYVVESVKKTVG